MTAAPLQEHAGPVLDESAIARALQLYRIVLPRAAQSGRVGGVGGAGPGGSLELHDFRHYVAGDDVRQIDWNAVARTGQTIVRIRREEVSPRIEIVLDASRSMAITSAKARRAAELAVLLVRLSSQQGLDPALIIARDTTSVFRGGAAEQAASQPFDGGLPLGEALLRGDALRTCGVRVVLSDFLFEAAFETLTGRLARGASRTALVQILDIEDLEPPVGMIATLVDSETGDRTDRELSPGVVGDYKRRLAALQVLLDASARRVQAGFATCVAQDTLDETLRTQLLGSVLQVRA